MEFAKSCTFQGLKSGYELFQLLHNDRPKFVKVYLQGTGIDEIFLRLSPGVIISAFKIY